MAAIDSFRTARWLRTLNLALQAFLLLTFVLGLNYLARDHPVRIDLTRYRRFSLSPETLSYLHELNRPVHIVVTSEDGAENPELRGLLSEYVYETEGNRDGAVGVEYIDLDVDRRKAQKFGIEQAGIILLLCGDRRSVLTTSELYRVENKEHRSFVGEQALTAAILGVSNPERKKIYFLVGHSELRPDDTDPQRGLSEVRDLLRWHNYEIDTLELSAAQKIPDDASLLVCVAPQSGFAPREVEMLRNYLGGTPGGRLILFLGPGPHQGLDGLRLDGLLLDWGVLVDDDLICEVGNEFRTDDGDLFVRYLAPHNPVTQVLVDYQTPLRVGSARSVRPLPVRSSAGGLTVVTLAAASPAAWGEVGFAQRGVQPYKPGLDIKGLPQMDPPNQLGIAVASARVAVKGNLPFSVIGGRLVVVGTGDLIANPRLNNPGTQAFFLGAVNWMAGNDTQLHALPRPIERFQLSLSAADALRLRYTLMLALPGAVALLGIAVYWARRR